VLFVTEEDRAAIRRVAGPAEATLLDDRTAVIPICVDVSRRAVVRRVPAPKRITILGTMYWPPNAEGAMWFADKILPRVLEAAPDAILTCVGKDPPDELALRARRFPDNMEVRGYVDDLAPLLAETGVFAVPLLSGGGMRVKILDAWSWGLPVVSTSVGAEGIQVTPGRDILIADQASDFADAVVGLLRDLEAGAALGRAGRETVTARYDTAAVYPQLEAIYAPALGARLDSSR
jgi:glycosyltransferase involved in cell wall biosynthesis